MAFLSRWNKIALVSLGAVGGGLAYNQLNVNNNKKFDKKFDVQVSLTNHYTPTHKWDVNWDHREPESITEPSNYDNPAEDNEYNEKLELANKGVRHLFLIRHGQYNINGKTDKDMTLTNLGRKQAELTGKRLASLAQSLDIKWDTLVRSTMTRAQETAGLIAKHLDKDIVVKDCELIKEGLPIPPEPPVRQRKHESIEYFQDGARIETAYRRYFYRGPPKQTQDTYTLLVCHGNVIRFFVCRALLFPPEGWLRIALSHGSITWISILPNGHVTLRALGDTGFLEPKDITTQ